MSHLCEQPFPGDRNRLCSRPMGHAPRHEATWEVERHIFLTVAWHVLDTRPEVIEQHAADYLRDQEAFAVQAGRDDQ